MCVGAESTLQLVHGHGREARGLTTSWPHLQPVPPHRAVQRRARKLMSSSLQETRAHPLQVVQQEGRALVMRTPHHTRCRLGRRALWDVTSSTTAMAQTMSLSGLSCGWQAPSLQDIQHRSCALAA